MRYRWLAFLAALVGITAAHADLFNHVDCYVGALGGANWMNHQQSEWRYGTKVGFLVGAYGGIRFCNGFHLQGELAYRRNDLKEVDASDIIGPDFPRYFSPGSTIGRGETSTAMVNILYELSSVCNRWTPYIGLGLGYGKTEELVVGNFAVGAVSCQSFAVQTIIGLSYAITPCFDLGLEYRYLRPCRHVESQAATLSLKQYF